MTEEADVPNVREIPRLLYTIEESAHALSIGRTRVFDLVRTNQLRSVKIGKSRRVPLDALQEYVRSIEDEAA
jgi:excisionase family DNA binding protein